MTAPAPGRARIRLLLTTALALGVCAALAGLTLPGFVATSDRLARADGRAFGTVTGVDGDTALLTWTPDGGGERTDRVPMAGPPPPAGTRAEVAYDPAEPASPLLPGAAVLARADRALTTLTLVALVAVLVVAVAGGQLLWWRAVARRPARVAAARRVRIRAGLLSRSWLETADRWIPVHPAPALLALPAPAEVTLRGDPRRQRFVAAEIDGRLVLPSGPVRGTEPRGWRTDNADAPDAETRARSRRPIPLLAHLRADAPLLLAAPVVALLWTVVDGVDLATLPGTTALLAALVLFWAALRGSDPT